MPKVTKKLISMDTALVKFIHNDLERIGHGSTFSGWISDLVKKELKNIYGLQYYIKLKKIRNELAEQN